MKKIMLTACFLLLIIFSKSQNLVPNYSFENDTACPNNFNQIYYSLPWFQPSIYLGNTTNSSSSDLFDSCASVSIVEIPFNDDGYQYARTGTRYAGLIVLADTINYREYLEVPLISPLIANRHYCVEFYVSLAEISGMAISNMGAFFSTDSLLDSTIHSAINYIIPQVENPIGNMLSDTSNWMLVSGMFIANGGEQYMTIGNFRAPANTNSQVVPNQFPNISSYYYIDDVSVIDCTGIGINEVKDKGDMVEVYPNPATSSLTLTLTKGEGIVALYNVLGECVLTTSIVNHKKEIDISFLPKGVYFVNVKSDTQSMNRKFVKE